MKIKEKEEVIQRYHKSHKAEIARQLWLLKVLDEWAVHCGGSNSLSTVSLNEEMRASFKARCNNKIERMREELKITCICFWYARNNGGYIGEKNQAGCCISCRMSGGHGDHCDNRDKRGVMCLDLD